MIPYLRPFCQGLRAGYHNHGPVLLFAEDPSVSREVWAVGLFVGSVIGALTGK